jgi:hypothetical protein
MPASRNTHVGIYASDIYATNYRKRVDDHLFTQADIGWAVPIGGEPGLPGGMRPRHVVGKDDSGRTHSIVAPDTTAAIWADPTNTTFDILGDDGALVTCTITGLVGEAVTLV